MSAAQQFPLISSAPIFPPAPTLAAKPVTVISEGGTAGTVIGPSNVIGTPEAPLRIKLERGFAEKEVLRNVKAPAARVPGILPLACTVHAWVDATEALSILALTWRK